MSDLTALRRDVAQANRIIEQRGLSNAFGHVSARIPGTDTFLLPTRRSPAFAEEDALLIVDTDGTSASASSARVSSVTCWRRSSAHASPS